jgi:hypothetical protein
LLYRPRRGLGWQGAVFFAFCCFAALAAAVAVNDGKSEFFRDLVVWGTGAVYTAYQWLWRSCRWVRVDAEGLEWRTPLRHGRVPLHEVRRISLDGPWGASIDIRGHGSLDLAVRNGFEDLTAAIVAGAPHVIIERPVPPGSPRRGPHKPAATPNVRPAVVPRQFLREWAKITDPRNPPEPVWVVDAGLDERPWPGRLYGWADNPPGGGAGTRGLVVAEQPNGRAFIGWALPEQLRSRASQDGQNGTG